ncbi:MAG TPA: response regulator transcription factor [Longimicrobiales bacterium]|nr:response regulator transcription factor [Longimicrobiales bacterium]
MRVLIADDHAVVRQGIRAVLESADDVEVVGEAATGDEAMTLVEELNPDVLVLDVNMPGADGLEVTRALREEGRDCRILILSMHDNPEYVLQALRLGADGYVLKDAGPAELRDAVQTVWEGREYMSDRVTHQLSVALRQELEREKRRGRLDALTPREREVMLEVATGKTSREIGEEFGISPRTVETHRERLMAKLRMGSVADLTRFVVEMGLEEEDPPPG